MKTLSLPSKIVAIIVATLLALMGILPFIGSSKAYAEGDAELQCSLIEITVSDKEGKDYIGTTFTGDTIYAQDVIEVTGSVWGYFNQHTYTYAGAEDDFSHFNYVGDYVYTLDGKNVAGTNWGHYKNVDVRAYIWVGLDDLWFDLEDESDAYGIYVQVGFDVTDPFTDPGANETFNWWITRMIIPIPTAVEGLVYNGTEQVGVEEGVGYVLEDATATDAGDYVAKASLANGNYKWDYGFAETAATLAAAEEADASLEKFNPETQDIDWSIAKAEPAIIKGDVKWVKGSKEGTELSTDGVMDQCTLITISDENGWAKDLYADGEALVEGITVASGSTILTADAAVLENLAPGTYTVKFEYNDENYDPDTVETTLQIVEPTTAKTGDNAGLIALAGLALVAAAGAGVVLSMRRRQN